MPALLAHTLSIEGPDAAAFAHAQFSSDIQGLPVGHWQWSAWLDPRGRVRALLNVARPAPERFLLLLRGGRADDLARALQPYTMRRRVTLTTHPVRTLDDAPARPMQAIDDDGTGPCFGMGTYAMRLGGTPDAGAAVQAWRREAIGHGHPWLPDDALDQILAPALDLQRLGGISLDKGCFPGQEIVARMHYRGGGGKQHLRHLRTDTDIAPGTALTRAQQTVATVLDSVPGDAGNHDVLAVVRDTLPHDETPVEVGGSTIFVRTINDLTNNHGNSEASRATKP